MSKHLQHDTAFAMAHALLEIVAPCIREEERRDAFSEFYRVCLAALESYEVKCNRMEARLRPLNN